MPNDAAAALDMLGEHTLADRLRRCLAAGRGRSRAGGWPWLCGSVGCPRCGRPVLRRWWAALLVWIGDHAGGAGRATSLFLPTGVDTAGAQAAEATRRLRRALRDLRDRLAGRDARWASVAFGALLVGPRPVVLVAHPDLPHAAVAAALSRRWPGGIARDGLPPAEAPDLHADPMRAASLAALRRGVEPVRVVVPPQRRGRPCAPLAERAAPRRDPWADPMPVCF